MVAKAALRLTARRDGKEIEMIMSEKMYSASEVNRMLEAVEQQKWNMFSDYEKLVRRITELENENKELIDRNRNLCNILIDTLKG